MWTRGCFFTNHFNRSPLGNHFFDFTRCGEQSLRDGMPLSLGHTHDHMVPLFLLPRNRDGERGKNKAKRLLQLNNRMSEFLHVFQHQFNPRGAEASLLKFKFAEQHLFRQFRRIHARNGVKQAQPRATHRGRHAPNLQAFSQHLRRERAGCHVRDVVVKAPQTAEHARLRRFELMEQNARERLDTQRG